MWCSLLPDAATFTEVATVETGQGAHGVVAVAAPSPEITLLIPNHGTIQANMEKRLGTVVEANKGNQLPLFAFFDLSCRVLGQKLAVDVVSQLLSCLVEQVHGET